MDGALCYCTDDRGGIRRYLVYCQLDSHGRFIPPVGWKLSEEGNMSKTKPLTGDMVPAPPADHLPPVQRPRPSLAPAMDALPSEWATNYDLTTQDGKAGLINAANPPEWTPMDGGTYCLLATNYIVMPDEWMDSETGEMVQGCATVLIGRDGKHVRFRNDWAPRRLHAMLALYSADEWARGIEIECYAADSRRKGRRYGSFRVRPTV